MRDWTDLTDVFEAGADDPVFDAFLVVGAVLVVMIAVVGRHLLTHLLVGGYICFFLLYLLVKSM